MRVAECGRLAVDYPQSELMLPGLVHLELEPSGQGTYPYAAVNGSYQHLLPQLDFYAFTISRWNQRG